MTAKERAKLENELNNMTMKDLVKSYNHLIESNKGKLTKPLNPVKKFASKKVGTTRIMKVLTDLDRTEHTVEELEAQSEPEAPKEDKPEAPAKPTEPNPDYYINEKGLEVIKGLTFGLYIKRGIILGIDREKLCKESLRLYTLKEKKDFEGAYMWYSFLLSSGRMKPTINGKEVR